MNVICLCMSVSFAVSLAVDEAAIIEDKDEKSDEDEEEEKTEGAAVVSTIAFRRPASKRCAMWHMFRGFRACLII